MDYKLASGWHQGVIDVPTQDGEDDVSFYYVMKLAGEPSETGIKGSRIIKLEIKRLGTTMVAYERGWELYPKTPEADVALYYFLEEAEERI